MAGVRRVARPQGVLHGRHRPDDPALRYGRRQPQVHQGLKARRHGCETVGRCQARPSFAKNLAELRGSRRHPCRLDDLPQDCGRFVPGTGRTELATGRAVPDGRRHRNGRKHTIAVRRQGRV